MQIRKKLTVFASMVVGVLLLMGCSSKKKNQFDGTLSVKTEVAQPYESSLTVSYPGKVKAQSDVSLAFRVSGTLLSVKVNTGSKVKKGEVLAEIDPRDYITQLNATQAEYNRIKGEASRIMTLYEKGSVSKNDYEKAKYGLDQISALLKAHKDALKDTKLIAPFNGYIQKKMFNNGETVSAGFPIVSMINEGLPEVEINIPATEFYDKDLFKDYSCSVDIFPNEVFPLTLVGIAHKANLNQLYSMRFTFDKSNVKRLPTPGMTATVTITKHADSTGLTIISSTSLFENEKGGSSIWLYNESAGTVSSREVKVISMLRNGKSIISKGINTGDRIVTAGVHSLKEGDKVVPLPPKSKTNIGGLL